MSYRIIHGDNLSVLPQLIDEGIRVDAVVTDPPYGLKFMGKKWDYDVPSVELWRLVFQILKPGGHVLAFGGTRTYHRMVVNLEDAGFEIRDQLVWLYGSGFPKSFDISKAIQKSANGTPHGGSNPNSPNHGKYKTGCSEDNLEGRGFGAGPGSYMRESGDKEQLEITNIEAQAWQGWGTALKPAQESIVLARKPLEDIVINNVMLYGTGGINIDGCRVGTEVRTYEMGTPGANVQRLHGGDGRDAENARRYAEVSKSIDPITVSGRFPSNVLLDEVAVEQLDEQTEGKLHKAGNVKDSVRHLTANKIYGTFNPQPFNPAYHSKSDNGFLGASRFFYCAKASAKERRDSKHPTVKPLALMRYLCRLITPPGGIVLDPYAGSGATGEAALDENFIPILIEMEESYIADINARLTQRPVNVESLFS